MTNYADYTYYQSDYLLGKEACISAEEFSYYAREASQLVNQYTFSRVDPTNVMDEVKQCTCELAELIYSQKHNISYGKTSESVGGYSVSYGTAKEQSDSVAHAQQIVINRHLSMTGLLYRGC